MLFSQQPFLILLVCLAAGGITALPKKKHRLLDKDYKDYPIDFYFYPKSVSPTYNGNVASQERPSVNETVWLRVRKKSAAEAPGNTQFSVPGSTENSTAKSTVGLKSLPDMPISDDIPWDMPVRVKPEVHKSVGKSRNTDGLLPVALRTKYNSSITIITKPLTTGTKGNILQEPGKGKQLQKSSADDRTNIKNPNFVTQPPYTAGDLVQDSTTPINKDVGKLILNTTVNLVPSNSAPVKNSRDKITPNATGGLVLNYTSAVERDGGKLTSNTTRSSVPSSVATVDRGGSNLASQTTGAVERGEDNLPSKTTGDLGTNYSKAVERSGYKLMPNTNRSLVSRFTAAVERGRSTLTPNTNGGLVANYPAALGREGGKLTPNTTGGLVSNYTAAMAGSKGTPGAKSIPITPGCSFYALSTRRKSEDVIDQSGHGLCTSSEPVNSEDVTDQSRNSFHTSSHLLKLEHDMNKILETLRNLKMDIEKNVQDSDQVMESILKALRKRKLKQSKAHSLPLILRHLATKKGHKKHKSATRNQYDTDEEVDYKNPEGEKQNSFNKIQIHHGQRGSKKNRQNRKKTSKMNFIEYMVRHTDGLTSNGNTNRRKHQRKIHYKKYHNFGRNARKHSSMLTNGNINKLKKIKKLIDINCNDNIFTRKSPKAKKRICHKIREKRAVQMELQKVLNWFKYGTPVTERPEKVFERMRLEAESRSEDTTTTTTTTAAPTTATTTTSTTTPTTTTAPTTTTTTTTEHSALIKDIIERKLHDIDANTITTLYQAKEGGGSGAVANRKKRSANFMQETYTQRYANKHMPLLKGRKQKQSSVNKQTNNLHIRQKVENEENFERKSNTP